MTVHGRALDAQETAQLAHLLERALPPHHALYRTRRGWYVHRWDDGAARFKAFLDAPTLPALLAKLQGIYCSQ